MAAIYSTGTHYLGLQFCKMLGLDEHDRLIQFPDAIQPADLSSIGLRPVIAFALTFAAFGYRQVRLADARCPLSVSAFLKQMWEEPGFAGLPIELVVDARTRSMDKGFVAWCEAQGVRVSTASKNAIKSVVAFNRAVQDEAAFGVLWDTRGTGKPSMEEGNRSLGNYRSFVSRCKVGNRLEDLQLEMHADLLERHKDSAPPAVADALKQDWDHHSLEDRPATLPSLKRARVAEDDLPPEILADLLTCWPQSTPALAKTIGVSTRELNWFAEGKADIGPAKYNLYQLLGISPHELDDPVDAGVFLHGGGPARSLANVYVELSRGGDLEFSFEARLPASGPNDGRFLVFAAYGELPNVVWFPPGAPTQKLLTPSRLINFEGVRNVPLSLAIDLHALRDSYLRGEDPRDAVQALVDRHVRYFQAIGDGALDPGHPIRQR